MKILIIGSMGFIGSHAYKYFSAKHQVWGADVVPNPGADNYYQLEKTDTDYTPVFNKHTFDICINASGNGSVPISINKPVFDFELNVTNTIKLLDAIRIHSPACKFINMSSAAVYGNPPSLPVTEDLPLKPMSPYGWHKLYAEQICKEYYYMYNLQTINLRLFSVYGEGLKKQLFWDTYQKCQSAKEIELFGSGNETRDFIYIGDLMKALECVVHRGLFNGEAINVSSGIETTIKEAATIFCASVDEKIKLKFNNIVKPGDPFHWRADISTLCGWGFAPHTTIQDGLKNTAQWLKQYHGA
ncbi:NAD-dependent epimerase/dehydratase family protein [Mucilaginibacter pedocola]|uniref:dTDP-glucose 4,6-dehydratase n=1 Tax=Mucilaginibacter pedocola TaxID=1792845 RepID=A0A1S9PES1_9SPHI|nr:NAD-dependent epimerase/dehydratase family protein [Mucilaginibacter pedocola]OOQ59461.1 dTDP-glucose 4,6-dehydratase [Mucilaginibacter pedocola]